MHFISWNYFLREYLFCRCFTSIVWTRKVIKTFHFFPFNHGLLQFKSVLILLCLLLFFYFHVDDILDVIVILENIFFKAHDKFSKVQTSIQTSFHTNFNQQKDWQMDKKFTCQSIYVHRPKRLNLYSKLIPKESEF